MQISRNICWPGRKECASPQDVPGESIWYWPPDLERQKMCGTWILQAENFHWDTWEWRQRQGRIWKSTPSIANNFCQANIFYSIMSDLLRIASVFVFWYLEAFILIRTICIKVWTTSVEDRDPENMQKFLDHFTNIASSLSYVSYVSRFQTKLVLSPELWLLSCLHSSSWWDLWMQTSRRTASEMPARGSGCGRDPSHRGLLATRKMSWYHWPHLQFVSSLQLPK